MTETPRFKGYFFPPEWAAHDATWLSWPHKESSWPGKLRCVYSVYSEFVKIISRGENVHINVNSFEMEQDARNRLSQVQADLSKITFHQFPTNDAWCRDHGPAFLINPNSSVPKLIVDWDYNAWGGKYPPFDLDDAIPSQIANWMKIPALRPGIVMEGGSVEINGTGTLLTTTSCLLNPNRNPKLNQIQIETYLRDYYGIEQVLWLGDGIAGDDTDGHIDDLTRFIDSDTVVTVVEPNKSDENHEPLLDNLKLLKAFRLQNGKQLNIIELPMPAPVVYEEQRLPASYANFYISNAAVVVPTYRCEQDDLVLDILTQCFPDREVVGLDSTDLIWGLGSFHCLSQQEPSV